MSQCNEKGVNKDAEEMPSRKAKKAFSKGSKTETKPPWPRKLPAVSFVMYKEGKGRTTQQLISKYIFYVVRIRL